LPTPELEPPIVLKPRFGSWGEDVIRCDDEAAIEETLASLRTRPWFEATGALAQKLVAPRGYDLRLVVARGRVIGAVRRVAAPGEWRTNVALGASRTAAVPPGSAVRLDGASHARDGHGPERTACLPWPRSYPPAVTTRGPADERFVSRQ